MKLDLKINECEIIEILLITIFANFPVKKQEGNVFYVGTSFNHIYEFNLFRWTASLVRTNSSNPIYALAFARGTDDLLVTGECGQVIAGEVGGRLTAVGERGGVRQAFYQFLHVNILLSRYDVRISKIMESPNYHSVFKRHLIFEKFFC